jgi:poly(hydroxyalkanoate) depolymerase family esterase
MDAPQMAAMVEACRLTRQGRLVEATALIQRTLTTPAVIRRAPDAPCAGEESSAASGRPLASSPPLPVRGGTLLRHIPSGWAHGRRAFPSRRASSPDLANGPPTPAPAPAPAAKRQESRFDALSYTNAAGTRAYRLYVPAGGTGGRLPLVVMLHGGTQDAASFAAATGMNDLAERQKFLVVYPEQPSSANAGKYWNWFAPGHQHRGAGEPSLIAGITRQAMDRYGVAATRVYVAGFSAGGAMAAVMAAVYPDLYAAVGVHSGLVYAAARDVPSAFAAMKLGPPRPAYPPAGPLPLIVFHGDRDTTVTHANAACLIDHVLAAESQDRSLAAPPTAVTSSGQVPGGHAYTRTSYRGFTGVTLAECWTIHQGGHGWSGGVPHRSYTDPRGPNASAEFIRFFDEHPAGVRAKMSS